MPTLSDPTLRLLLNNVYGRAKDCHAEIYAEIANARRVTPRLSLPEMVDLLFIFDQSEQRIEDLRKELSKFCKQMIAIICAQWVKDNLTEINVEPIRGELATGSPDVGKSITLPKSDSQEYADLLFELCIPPKYASLIRIHWPAMSEYISAILSAGGAVPECLRQQITHPEYKCTLRPKTTNPIDELLTDVRVKKC